MKYFVTLAAICFTLPLWGQRNPVIEQFQAERIYAQGLSLYQQGAYRDAIGVFDRVATLDDDHPSVYEFRAESYYQLGDYRAAVRDYDRALRQAPNDVELLNSAGVAAGQLAMYGPAIAYFDRALVLDPNHKEAQHNRSEALRRQSQQTASNTPFGRVDPFAPTYGGNNNLGPAQPTILDLKAFSLTRGQEQISPVGQPVEQSFGTSQAKQEERFIGRDIKVGKQSDPYLSIERVVIRENETEIGLRVTNVSSKPYPLFLAAKGSEEAFFLTNQGLDHFYELRDVRNFPEWSQGKPKRIPAGKSDYLVLIFRRLDDDVRTFHLIEGKTPRPGMWNFWQVSLPK
jgi:hypothetical protein